MYRQRDAQVGTRGSAKRRLTGAVRGAMWICLIQMDADDWLWPPLKAKEERETKSIPLNTSFQSYPQGERWDLGSRFFFRARCY